MVPRISNLGTRQLLVSSFRLRLYSRRKNYLFALERKLVRSQKPVS
jgi:hypothetical protein